jgi:hypothetical protein
MPLPTLATPPLIVPAIANLLPSPFVEQRAGIGDHAAKRQCSPVVDRNGAGNGGAAAISSVSLNASIVALLPEVFSTPPKMTASLSWTSAPLPRASITAAAVLPCRQSLGPNRLEIVDVVLDVQTAARCPGIDDQRRRRVGVDSPAVLQRQQQFHRRRSQRCQP